MREDRDMSSVLDLQGVTKRYGWRGPWVLSGADLKLEAGTLTWIVGSNGSGKTTLLRIAAGVTSPSRGSALVPRRVGFVPERQAARGKFTGAEYLAHMGRIRGLDRRFITERSHELFTRLGVRPGPEAPWNNLSKGNRQKVVIAQAFLGRRDSVILDEPYSGLDDHARQSLDDLIDEVRGEGTSVLVSSHDPPLGPNRAFRLVDGQLSEDASSIRSKSTDPMRRVELVRDDETQPDEGLTRRDSVLQWQTTDQGRRLALVVSSEGCDDVLRAALDLGWSVESVAPSRSAGRE